MASFVPRALVGGGVRIPLSAVPNPRVLKRNLTAQQWVMGEEGTIDVPAYEVERAYITVPRAFGLHLIAEMGLDYDDARSDGAHRVYPKAIKHEGQYAYQESFVAQMVSAAARYGDFLAEAATGMGKCLAKGTPVLLYDGTVKRVEHVRVGDLLMGPASTARRVRSLAHGYDDMYAVVPTKGDTYVVNSSHILSLRITGLGSGKRVLAGDGNMYTSGDLVNISISDYMASSKFFRHVAKGWRVGVEFGSGVALPLPPYFLGTWLGDGTSSSTAITTADVEILQAWQAVARTYGLALVEDGGNVGSAARTYRLSSMTRESGSNAVSAALRALGVLKNKHVPDEYRTASRQERLELLAGILDTDGCASCGCYDYVTVSSRLAEDVVFLVRSLGLAAYRHVCQKTCTSTGATGTYYRVCISGDTAIIPCRLPRRQVTSRRQKKNQLITGITVSPVGRGEYFGFTLDGDGLFLLGDFTVTHNTEMALSMIQRLGRTALIVVDQENLLTQWLERAKSSLGLTDKQIGIVQGSTCAYEGKHLVIAMMQSLSQRRYEMPLYDWPGIVVFDECHTAGAPTFSKVMLQFSARVRVGVSATIDRRDALQKLIHWNLGEVRASLKQAHSRSYVYYVESPTVYSWYATISPKTGRIIEEVSSDPVRNRMLVQAIQWLYETGRDTLVVSDRIEQLEALRSMLHYSGVPAEDTGLYCGYRTVWQYEKDPTPKRKPDGYEKGTEYTPIVFKASRKRVSKAELEKVKKTAKVLFATYGMMAKGVDVPRLSGGIDCTHRTKAQQVHGRVLRHVDGKLVPVWITVRDINCYRLEHQFLQRLDEYSEDNAEVYQFDLESEAVRKVSLPSLKKDIRENIKELKCLKTVAHADGGYVLVSP